MVEAIIFDMDGVLFDTEKYYLKKEDVVIDGFLGLFEKNIMMIDVFLGQ